MQGRCLARNESIHRIRQECRWRRPDKGKLGVSQRLGFGQSRSRSRPVAVGACRRLVGAVLAYGSPEEGTIDQAFRLHGHVRRGDIAEAIARSASNR